MRIDQNIAMERHLFLRFTGRTGGWAIFRAWGRIEGVELEEEVEVMSVNAMLDFW